MTYKTYDAAAARVDVLRRAGVWPGIIHCSDGYQLTCDPWDGAYVHTLDIR